jgi:hypothetical protein
LVERDPESLEQGGSPGFVDAQASDADAIGIYPVHTRWTIVDGVDRWDAGRIGGN